MSDKDKTKEEVKRKVEKKAEQYFEKYPKQMEDLEKSSLAKVAYAETLPTEHYFLLGEVLERVADFNNFVNEEGGNLNLMGLDPQIMMDVITATYGSSIINFIASTQAIQERAGIVYFMNVEASQAKGNLSAGDRIVDPRQPSSTPEDYALGRLSETAAATAGAQVSYTFTLTRVPVYANDVMITIPSLSADLYAKDDPSSQVSGVAKLIGYGMSGTINYNTGVVNLELAADPLAAHNIVVSYRENYELAVDIPAINYKLDSTLVRANEYALHSVMSIFEKYTFSKRFGSSFEDRMSAALVESMNREIGGEAIKLLFANKGTEVVSHQLYSDFLIANPGTAVTEKAHRESYVFRRDDAEEKMLDKAGRGTIGVHVVGKTHARVIQGLEGFKKLTDGKQLGAHLFGTLDGVPVIRVTDENILPKKEGLVMWKGNDAFDTPLVFAPKQAA